MHDGFGIFIYSGGGASLILTHVERKTSHHEIVTKSLARFNTQFKLGESYKRLLTLKADNTLGKIWATESTLSRPHSRIRPSKQARYIQVFSLGPP